ncbi:protein kinase domain-containing protein [Halalkalibacillus sediminis]|uniref:protein kinase domain-containing protein n=1 Tax=Halalkalibacillus sediminis TaxID=2018042 RepID=UPI001EE49FE0|nr:protein kinase [Halalkalibacillus sediminis]
MSFKLKEPHDFSWLKDLGEVVNVFDQQDSGNICFVVESQFRRLFIKYAGARTVQYGGVPEDAIQRLKEAVTVYESLKHPHLTELLDHFETASGYVLVFEWFDGENLHPHWRFPPPHKYTHPESPYYKFKQLTVGRRLKTLTNIFEFHVHVEREGYVAIDFYDGSIMYDFQMNLAKICDIDLYRKKPYTNTIGRMWGSKRFMSPEEFEKGALIDTKTNVYNMGAIAFSLLGGELDRTIDKWEANIELYDVVKKATNPNREKRYPTIEAFYHDWVMNIN